jgi:hypothetical protein
MAMQNHDGSPMQWRYPTDESVDIAIAPVDWGAIDVQTEWMIAASLVGGNSGSPIFFAPSAITMSNQPARAILLGVQSTSFEGTDVAGMAPSGLCWDLEVTRDSVL